MDNWVRLLEGRDILCRCSSLSEIGVQQEGTYGHRERFDGEMATETSN